MTEKIQNLARKRSKLVLATMLSVLGVFVLSVLFDIQHEGGVQSAQATSTATTTVTVLNTPPAWDIPAYEYFPSATNTPTNVGTSTWWAAQVTDSNSEDWYLLICKSSSTPTSGPTGGPPTCGGGGIDQWAVSGALTSGSIGTVATSAQQTWAEKNDWYAYVCDANPGGGACNEIMYNGLHEAGPASATSSPFVVNHPATITLAEDTSPTLPGNIVTWTAYATDTTDVLRGPEQLQVYICQTNVFDADTPDCPGGTWAYSELAGLANPSTSTTLTIPLQDRDFDAHVYIVDAFGLEATGAWQGSSTVLTVENAAPVVSSSTITLYDAALDQNLSLTVEEGETPNFLVEFQVVDDNSCEAFGGGDELLSADINVFRYDGTDPYTFSLTCDASGEYDANDCYTHTNPYFNPLCSQRAGSCTGDTDVNAIWECTFPMWYIADPTDVGSEFSGHDWRASARVSDEALTSPYSTYDDPVDDPGASNMEQFLSFRATGSPIAYGSLEPGQNNPTHTASTTVYATGNTGLDHYLSGDAMCVTFPACSNNPTDTIYVPYQRYSLVFNDSFANGTQLTTSTAPVLVDVAITKPDATSTGTGGPNDTTFWAIEVPSSISFSGDYLGNNYIDAAVAPSVDW